MYSLDHLHRACSNLDINDYIYFDYQTHHRIYPSIRIEYSGPYQLQYIPHHIYALQVEVTTQELILDPASVSKPLRIPSGPNVDFACICVYLCEYLCMPRAAFKCAGPSTLFFLNSLPSPFNSWLDCMHVFRDSVKRHFLDQQKASSEPQLPSQKLHSY